MKMTETLTKIANTTNQNKGTIFTIGACVGVVGTVIFSALGAIRAKQHLDEADGVVTKETVGKVAIDIAPAAITAGLTITCVILAHKTEVAKYAAIAAVYAKDSKTVESITSKVKIDKDGNITIDPKDKVDTNTDEIFNKNGEVLTEEVATLGTLRIFDRYSGQWYDCTIEDIRRAVRRTNDELLAACSNYGIGVYAADTFYYDMQSYAHNGGITKPELLEGMGWTGDDGAVEVEFDAELDDNLRPYYTINFITKPHNIDNMEKWKRY